MILEGCRLLIYQESPDISGIFLISFDADLAAHGVQVGVCKIKRIRKNLNIHCKQKKKFKATTDARHAFPIAENVMDQHLRLAGRMPRCFG